MNLSYGELLTRAWQLTWKHKVLWIFGILAGLGSGGTPSADTDYRTSSGSGDLPPQVERFIEQFDPNMLIALAVGLACVALLIGVVFIALQVIGRGGLIGGLRQAQATGAITFGEAWQIGLSRFWTLFLIGLAVGLVTVVAALVILVPGIFLAVATLGLGLLCLFPLICVLVVAAGLLNIVAYFAQIAAVVEGLGVMDSLRRGWDVIRAHFGQILILGLIVIVIQFVAGLIISLPILIAVVPAVIGMVGFASDSQVTGLGGLAFALICCAAYLPVLLVLGGVLQTWVTGVWTLAYEQLIRPAAPGGPAAAPQFPA